MRAADGWDSPRSAPSKPIAPEDPTYGDPRHRRVRDWIVDTVAFIAAIGVGALVLGAARDSVRHGLSSTQLGFDVLFGLVACMLLWWRRRWPIVIAVVTGALSIGSAFAGPAAAVALFTVVVHRRTSVAMLVVGVNLAAGLVYALLRPDAHMSLWAVELGSVVAVAILTAWALFVRARRMLVWTLRERAERAEAEQRLRAEQARRAERTRIAREMHDVLAHRISLLALHAGGLQVRPDLPPEQVRETATLLRDTAHRALEELRGVIGVLRDDAEVDDAPAAPQPTLRDIARLVDETRQTGARIDLTVTVPPECQPPDALGRDAYRIVQEALTNVAKHARGTATSVAVTGAPGDGLRVIVRNRLPVAVTLPPPGSGRGLLGLRERVALAGGTLVDGPDGEGDFLIDATLAWG